MKHLAAFSLLLAVCGICGCVAISASSDYVSGTDFSNLKTYNWVAGPQPIAGDTRIDNTLTNQRIRNAIDQALAAQGYVKTSSGTSDFLVSYQAAIEGKLNVTTIDIPYQTPSTRDLVTGSSSTWNLAHGGRETFVNQYDEGSLFIDIVDPKTNELMWRGTGKATVLEKATPEKREARINEGVKKILSQFPPTR